MMPHNIKPRSRVSQSRVWVYFKQSDGDPDKARCNLCSIEICHRGTTKVLWNHVKIKHSIDRNNLSQDNRDDFESSIPIKKQTQASTRSNSNNHQLSRRNTTTDLILDYNDLSLTSMKPLPSTSLSKNLIARLNQLSSPVTRKLKFWNKKSFQVNQYDPSFKVIYLGNLGVQLWSKDESCLDKPLSTLWNNYLVNMKTEIVMRLTICNSGLKAITRQHGLTQYWSNRLVYCCSHKNYPRIFSWVYRHEGKKMRQELRCHAVFCPSPEKASRMVTLLNERIACALQEFRREKKSRSSSTIVTNNESLYQNLQRTVPLRRQILAKGSANFRPPLERSKSAPKLTSILEEEDYESSEEENEMVEQDVFEYEESFGDRDDDDEDEDYDVDDDANSEDNKIESNSLTTTVNEETSNSSAYATSDRSFEKRNSYEVNQIYTLNHNQNQNHNHNQNQNQNHNHHNQNHSSQINQNKSANNNTIRSSSPSRQITMNDDNKLLQVDQKQQAKNNNAVGSNKNEPPPVERKQEQLRTDDTTTNEIILSWSNLVIK